MNTLVLGSGGREQALAWKIAQSPLVDKVYIAPGNAGALSKCESVALDLRNVREITNFITDHQVELIVVGPEQPLVDGIVDELATLCPDISIVGPTAEGAKLESSKKHAKEFMKKQGIRTAEYRAFKTGETKEAQEFLRSLPGGPYVLKADGLAAGKGVLIIDNLDNACREVSEMLSGKFGTAGSTVVIEQYLDGIECSVFVLTDGNSYKILPVAKDYKRIGEGDTGLNTGGMGAVSPVPFADSDFMKKVEEDIVKPTIQGLTPEVYKGFVFIGLMNVDGTPYVIEYNCRMGDPETEAVMPRVESDLVPYLLALKDERLHTLPALKERDGVALTVIMASNGYPEEYEKGIVITNIPTPTDDVVVFHAGTKVDDDGNTVTNGGRVLAVTVLADSITQAREKAYHTVGTINFDNAYCRHDIGNDLT